MKTIDTILITFIIVVLIYLIMSKGSKKENLDNVSDSFVDGVYKYIQNADNIDNTFENYVTYLINVQNTNLNLINEEVFAGFRYAKKNNIFTKQNIIDELK